LIRCSHENERRPLLPANAGPGFAGATFQFQFSILMWILPKQLHTSGFVRDAEALNLDLNESSQLCAQSLFVRSKPSPLRTWLQKWKRDLWTQHLFGRILKPSLGNHFETVWTSSLAVIPASHSAQPVNASEPTIQDTSGQALQPELPFCDPASVSSRMSRDTLASDSEMSLQTWNALVTKRRGEYLARLNAARHTSASECSLWPTPSTRDWKDTPGMATKATNPDGSPRKRLDQLARAVYFQQDPESPSINGSHRGLLNPRWVETLLGLPVGWTQPSCLHPIVPHANAAESQSVHDATTITPSARAQDQTATMTDSRTDELRLLGNGVVPATAAKAFRTLINQF
jgi:hypothetical protein